MSADLSDLGLVPAGRHPDAKLFELIAREKQRLDEWASAQSEAARRRLLVKWRKDCPIRQEEQIARFTPSTLEGLVEKATAALSDWREDKSAVRYRRSEALMATALEQAMRILQAQRSVEMPLTDRGAA